MAKQKKPTRTPAQPPKKQAPKRTTLKVVLFLSLLVLGVYGNTIPNRFSLDDDMVTQNNPVIKKGIKGIPEILRTRYASNPKQNYEYRPIVKITFAIEHSLFNGNPHVSHFINVLLFLALCLVLYFLLRKLLRSFHPWIPILAVAIFAVHPIHTEVVASLKNRDEILSMLGSLLTLWAFLKFHESRKWYWIPIGLVVYALGYFSKSSALVFLALIPLTLYYFTDLKMRDLFIIIGVLLVVVILLRFLPRTFLPKTEREILYFENPLYFEKGIWLKIGTALYVLLFYFRLLIFPHPLLFYYGYDMIPVTGPGNIWSILSLVICLALFIFALWRFRKKHILSFCILFFFVSISMYANIIKPPPGIVAERFLMVPSLAYCLALTALAFMVFKIRLQDLQTGWKQLRKPVIVIAVIMVPMTIKTVTRNPNWKTFESLYSHDIDYLRNSAKANSVYAALLSDKIYSTKDKAKSMQYAEMSMKYYKQALKVYPAYPTCWNNLGIIHYRVYKNTAEGIKCWRQAAKYDAEYADPFYNIAIAYENQEKLDSAEFYYLKAIRIKKDFSYAYSNLANLYYKKGNMQKAIATNEQLMKEDPTTDIPFVNIGNYYLLQKDTVQAIAWWEKAIEKQPMNANLDKTLSNYYRHLGDLEKADHYALLAKEAERSLKEKKNE
jgi:tetratricopeptide (TPR) repeat protein